MKKIYFTLFIWLLCTASVFSTQLYNNVPAIQTKNITPTYKDSTSIISGIIALPSFR